MTDDLQDKLDNLDARIKTARENGVCEDSMSKTERLAEESGGALKESAVAGSEFLASVIAGAVLGFGIDWFFSTKPWGMIFFILIGFVGGVMRANASMNKNEDESKQ